MEKSSRDYSVMLKRRFNNLFIKGVFSAGIIINAQSLTRLMVKHFHLSTRFDHVIWVFIALVSSLILYRIFFPKYSENARFCFVELANGDLPILLKDSAGKIHVVPHSCHTMLTRECQKGKLRNPTAIKKVGPEPIDFQIEKWRFRAICEQFINAGAINPIMAFLEFHDPPNGNFYDFIEAQIIDTAECFSLDVTSDAEKASKFAKLITDEYFSNKIAGTGFKFTSCVCLNSTPKPTEAVN